MVVQYLIILGIYQVGRKIDIILIDKSFQLLWVIIYIDVYYFLVGCLGFFMFLQLGKESLRFESVILYDQ